MDRILVKQFQYQKKDLILNLSDFFRIILNLFKFFRTVFNHVESLEFFQNSSLAALHKSQ